jgi:TRAP-type mannitol/chloroaromatic compound transport system substrate-binding protein
MPAGDVYQALEKGTLDATEFVGPYDDQKLGFNKVAPFYYYPGWWEGGAELEFFINAKAYAALSARTRPSWMPPPRGCPRHDAKYDAFNPVASSAGGRQDPAQGLPQGVMDAGFKASMEVFAEHEAKSPEFKKIHQDMRAFQRDQLLWDRFSEFRYDSYMAA